MNLPELFRTLYLKLKDSLDNKKKITAISTRGKSFDEDSKIANISKSKKCDCMEIYINSKIKIIRKHRKFHYNQEVEPMLRKIMDIELDIFNEFYKHK